MLMDDKKLFDHNTSQPNDKIICRSCFQLIETVKMKSVRSLLSLDAFLFEFIPPETSVLSLYNYCTKPSMEFADGLAEHICSPCLRKLINTYEFLKQCELANTKLLALVQMAEQKDDLESLSVYVEDVCFEDIITIDDEPPPVKSEEDEYFKEEEELENQISAQTVIQTLDIPVIDEGEQHEKSADEVMLVERLYDSQEEHSFVASEYQLELEEQEEPEEQQQPEAEPEENLTADTLVQCTICSKEMLFKYYKTHCMQQHRNTNKKYECKQCNTVLSTMGNFTKHLNSKMHRERRPGKSKQSKNKRSPCTICGRVFTVHYLETHMMCHYSVKPYTCDVESCKASFYSKSSLATHKTNVHFPNLVAPEAMLLCPHCGKKFANSRVLSQHARTHDKYNENSKRREDCKICRKSITVKDMTAHVRSHTGERPYKCSVCGKAFAQSGTMKTHEMRHKTERPYPCTVCEKSFARPAQLNIHVRSHTGERPFVCDVCPKSFTRNDQLLCHRRTHESFRPYQCKVCIKSYFKASILKDHEYSHKGKSCKCHVCLAAFTYPIQLKKHLKTKHNITSAELQTLGRGDLQIVEEECQTTEEAEQHVEVQTT